MIDMKNKKNNSHYRDCGAITDNLSRIKKEAAEIFGSCVASPKITIQRHSEAQPKNPRKVQHNDWILHFAFAPFRMTIPAQALALISTFGTIGESRAACSQTNTDGKTVNELGNYCGTCGTNCNWVVRESNKMRNSFGRIFVLR